MALALTFRLDSAHLWYAFCVEHTDAFRNKQETVVLGASALHNAAIKIYNIRKHRKVLINVKIS